MTATETTTTNSRVLGADPFVPDGIGEEVIVAITLPFIHSAREGVERLGELITKYGTYESNGISFADVDEIWWFETVGGHHWLARKVPDDMVVIMPNQFGLDEFDLEDAFGAKENYMCSEDLREFIVDNHLDLNLDGGFNPRYAFGSYGGYDEAYNTPRGWNMARTICPTTYNWYGEDADFTVYSEDIPWMLRPERKLTIEDMKDILTLHFQHTDYDFYATHGPEDLHGSLRAVGMNRNCVLSILQLRPYAPKNCMAIQWVAFSVNMFNAIIPLYANVSQIPEYLSNTTRRVDTDNLYWCIRLISAMADRNYLASVSDVEDYQQKVTAKGHEIIKAFDAMPAARRKDVRTRERANEEMVAFLKKETDVLLAKVLNTATDKMKSAFTRESV